MKKNEFVDLISQKAGFSKADAAKALEAVTDVIADAMKLGQKLMLGNLGSFEVGQRAARTCRNPQTGQPMQVAASKVVRFKVAKRLKDVVNA
jgi:DNA-binding protein HU-beta